jgi:hypothetical protein
MTQIEWDRLTQHTGAGPVTSNASSCPPVDQTLSAVRQ